MSQRLRRAWHVTMVGVVSLGLAAVGAGAAPSIEVETAVGEVSEPPTKADLRTLADRLDRVSDAVAALTASVQSLAARLEGAPAREALTALSTEVATLAGRMDELSAQLARHDREPQAVAVLAPPSHDLRSATEPAPRDLYRAAYIDFSRGNYAPAIGAFREFVRRHPGDELADNAAYWIAESYFSLAHRYHDAGEVDLAAYILGEAVRAFREVAERYPHGDKTPTALYREALALVERQEPELARTRLRSLVESFPRAPEARFARERLEPRGAR